MLRKMPRFGPEASPLRLAIVPLSIWLIKLEPDRLLINFMISTPKIVANVSIFFPILHHYIYVVEDIVFFFNQIGRFKLRNHLTTYYVRT